jgi:hypothetical protein
MSLDIKKLENVQTKTNGKIIARCPACAVSGGDEKGEHLFVNTDGRFGCVVHQGNKAHNKTIFALVGVKDGVAAPIPIIKIRRMDIPESKVVMVIGTLKKRMEESVVGNCSDEEDEAEAA